MLVFLSSTIRGHEERRLLLKMAIVAAGHTPILSEEPGFPVPPRRNAHDVCLDVVADAGAVVVVLQREYGQIYEGVRPEYRGLSLSHAEYREAVRLGKWIIVLADGVLPEERRARAAGSAPADASVPAAQLDFYGEVADEHRWVDFFRNSAECRDLLASRLANPEPYDHVNREKRFGKATPGAVPGGLDVLSTWRCYSESFDVVRQEWIVTFTNFLNHPVILSEPLNYPVLFTDTEILAHTRRVLGTDEHPLAPHPISVSERGNIPVITFAADGPITLGPGEGLEISTTMRHGQYFSQVRPGQWVHRGRLFFLDYPGFKGRSLVQRIRKEYWIPKTMLLRDGRALHVLGSPNFDWTFDTPEHRVFGYGRSFEFGGSIHNALTVSD